MKRFQVYNLTIRYYGCKLIIDIRDIFLFTQRRDYMKDAKKVILTCSVCLSRNYSTNKNNNNKQRIELMKFCPKCNKHTLHKETK